MTYKYLILMKIKNNSKSTVNEYIDTILDNKIIGNISSYTNTNTNINNINILSNKIGY
jgi:hypothetical protein